MLSFFVHNARKMETSGTRAEGTCQVTSAALRNPSALNPLTPAGLPAHSGRLQVPHSLPQPPARYSQIPKHSSHIFLQPSSPSFTSLHPPSLPTPFRTRSSAATLPASKPPLRPSSEPAAGPASLTPLAPTPLPRGAPAPRPPPPRSARLSAGAEPRPPDSRCRARTRRTPPPRTPGPLPAPPQPSLPSRSPSPPLPPQPVCKGGRLRRAPLARLVAQLPGLQGVWAGRQAAGGGRLCTRAPRAAQPRTAPAPANNRLWPQRSASYRRRRVGAEARGSLGNGVSARPTPHGMPGVGGGERCKAQCRFGARFQDVCRATLEQLLPF